ncbi:hypothetical protein HYX13_02595 [Candidatus Woesearchaeota archaeon]|nr:hypothetical protein [Candidatus Woesearchaeota archaeon]
MSQMSQYNAGQSFSQRGGFGSSELGSFNSGSASYSASWHSNGQSGLEHIAHQEVTSSAPSSIPASASVSRSYSSVLLSLLSHSYVSSPLASTAFFSGVRPYISHVSVGYAPQQRNEHFGHAGHYLSAPSHTEYHFQPDQFLKPGKEGKFVGQAEDIKEFIIEAFEKMLHSQFPEDIKISVCTEEEFRKIAPHPGTIGLSINRRKQGLLSEIFVLAGPLGRVLLTVGHELGHVFTGTLEHAQDEEAKAYAFSMAWMEVIKEQNIAGLSTAFVEESPAQNGLHDVAFGFVSKLLREGEKAWNVWEGLVSGELAVAG